jgi:hypothetical protein
MTVLLAHLYVKYRLFFGDFYHTDSIKKYRKLYFRLYIFCVEFSFSGA